MKNLDSVYILLDTLTRVALFQTPVLSVASFVQRHVLDTRANGYSKQHVDAQLQKLNLASADNYALQRFGVVTKISEPLEQKLAAKKQRSILLSSAYNYLLWYANIITETAYHTTSVGVDDIQDVDQSYVVKFAAVTGLSLEAADKQVKLDRDFVLGAVNRRREVLWKYELKAAAVTSQAELKSFKAEVFNEIINVGAV